MKLTENHKAIVLTISAVAIVLYALVSCWVLLRTDDAALQGDVVGTWKSFAVAAFSFWLGSSISSRTKDDALVGREAVQKVEVTNDKQNPVKTEETSEEEGAPWNKS